MKPEREQLPQEQAAELAALEAQAGAEVAPVQAAEAAAPSRDLAAEIKALTLAFVGMAAPILPSLRAIYTEDATAAAAGAVAAVCQKHGWLQSGLVGDYGEEIAAAVVLLPLALATYRGVTADIAAMKPKPQGAALPDTGGPVVSDTGAVNQKTVVFGAPIPSPEGVGAELAAAA